MELARAADVHATADRGRRGRRVGEVTRALGERQLIPGRLVQCGQSAVSIAGEHLQYVVRGVAVVVTAEADGPPQRVARAPVESPDRWNVQLLQVGATGDHEDASVGHEGVGRWDVIAEI